MARIHIILAILVVSISITSCSSQRAPPPRRSPPPSPRRSPPPPPRRSPPPPPPRRSPPPPPRRSPPPPPPRRSPPPPPPRRSPPPPPRRSPPPPPPRRSPPPPPPRSPPPPPPRRSPPPPPTRSPPPPPQRQSPPPPALTPPPAPPAPAPAFTSYLLALQWIQTYCVTDVHVNPAECYHPGDFSIHGLWPQHSDYHSEDALDFTNLIPLGEDRMYGQWPAPSGCPHRARGLWMEQWEDHGAQSTLSQEDYFGTTLDLREELGNIAEALADLSSELQIEQGESYDRDRYKNAFDAVLRPIAGGSDPIIVRLKCKQNTSGEWFLDEVRLCYDNSQPPRLQACMTDDDESCPDPPTLISLPPKPPLGIN